MPTLNWIGKDAVVHHHKEVPFHLLKCDEKLSVSAKTSEFFKNSEVSGGDNLLVQGDNLLALKALLPHYAGEVKCIYIDPPYNTGNEGWVYNDNVNSPEMKAWLGKVVGGESEDLSRHDKWLCMMYPRLILLRDMLREDGSLWINLDDNEIHHARLLLDETFGSRNFVANVIWEKSDSPKMDSRYFSLRHDNLIMYAKNLESLKTNRLLEETGEHYNKVDNSGRSYYTKPLRAMGGQGDSRIARPNLYFPIIAPDGTEVFPKKTDGSDGAWRWSKEKIEEEQERIEWVKGKNNWSPYFRIYSDTTTGRPPETIWFHSEVGSNRTSKAEIKSLFPDENSFDTPKPIRLLQRILQIATNPGDLILDSFAGSGTTGHAVLQMNKEDGGNRRFILVEMDENISKNITAERLKRVSQGYEWKDQKGDKKKEEGLGGGFRFCALGETLFDADGQIRLEVSFEDLARHVYFTETGMPLPERPPSSSRTRRSTASPLLGIHNGVAVYLLYNGIMKDKSRDGGNVLTRPLLAALPEHDGAKVIYGNGTLLGENTLRSLNITFRQVPYEIKIS